MARVKDKDRVGVTVTTKHSAVAWPLCAPGQPVGVMVMVEVRVMVRVRDGLGLRIRIGWWSG